MVRRPRQVVFLVHIDLKIFSVVKEKKGDLHIGSTIALQKMANFNSDNRSSIKGKKKKLNKKKDK